MLPQLAQGEANKIFVILRGDVTALSNLTGRLAGAAAAEVGRRAAAAPVSSDEYAAEHTTPEESYLRAARGAPSGRSPRRRCSAGRWWGGCSSSSCGRCNRSWSSRSGRTPATARAVDGARAAAAGADHHARGGPGACRVRPPASSSATGASRCARSDALETIASLDGPLDLVFVDANKDGYVDYYEAVLPKLAHRGSSSPTTRSGWTWTGSRSSTSTSPATSGPCRWSSA